MPMRKSKGNMYGFVTHTWNPIKGRCPHECSYCYMRRFPLNEIRLDQKELKTDLGSGNYIFMGSGTDAWCDAVPSSAIHSVINKIRNFPENKYLFQSKNPDRFLEFYSELGSMVNITYCTTIESNRQYPQMGNAPSIRDRAGAMLELGEEFMLTIEPIMDFDLDEFVLMIRAIDPFQVNIGADSKRSGLTEPTPEKIEALIEALKCITTVHLKDNLSRLRKGASCNT